jgi:hypothetical protein
MASSGGSINFSVVPNDINCALTWELNGVAVGSGNFVDIYSSNANLVAAPANNAVKVTLNNGIHSPTTKTWTLVKNTPPSCLSPTPSTYTGNTLTIPSSLNLGIIASDANSDPMNFSWKVNGVGNPSSLGTPTSSGSASLVTFTPSGANIGNNNLTVDINDGYDTTQCSWSVSASGDCGVTAESPSTASSVRVAASATTLNTFSLTTNTLGCGATWTLNGSPISGASLSQQIQSSQLLNGANSLTATVQNGNTSTLKVWTILKNNLPTCSASPINTGPVISGVGVAQAFVATASDADSDSVSFSWLFNNANPGALIVPSASGNVGTGTYTGTSGSIGTGTITAVMNDGFDTNRCDWSVTTVDACTISSSLPNVATMRMAAFGGMQTFGIVPNNSSCLISWKLNGVSLGSGNFFDLYSANSNLVEGANTLEATIDNGIHSTVTRTWTVTKNAPPSCSAKNPAGNVTINYGNTQVFTGTVTNTDSDTITHNWTFNGGSPGLFSSDSTSSGAGTSSATATFSPLLAQLGNSHNVSVTFSDGYDSNTCSWSVDVLDPSQVTITSCLPSENSAVVYSEGSNSSRIFTVSATGPSLSYQWQLDGTNVGANAADHTFAAGALSVGSHTAKVTVTDQYGNHQECNWNIKRNAKPTITAISPSAAQSTRLNISAQLPMNITATDGNSDSLTYQWTINGGTNSSVLGSGLSSTNFNPNGSTGFLGSNTIVVTVSDGHESATQSWTVEGNYFSTACNYLYNGPVSGTGATGGRICTLVGSAGVGNGLIPTDDQGLIKIQPTYQIDDGEGNLIISDIHSHTVYYYNQSSVALTRFGKTIPVNKFIALIGNGTNGRNDDLSYNTDFKLNNPYGLAYDSTNQKLYIADSTNHRVVVLDNSGQAQTIFGNFGTTQNSTTNAEGALGTTLSCGNPQGLIISSGWLYIACLGTNNIKKLDIDPLSATYLKGYTVVGWLNSASSTVAGGVDGTPGPTGTARANGPAALALDGDNNLYWSEYSSHRVRMLNLSGANKSFFTNRSISGGFNLGAADISATALTAPSGISIQANYTATAPDTLYVWGPTRVNLNTCVHYRVQSRATTTPAAVTANTTLTITAPAGGTIYSDSGCTTSGTIQIANGTSETDFYYKRTAGTGAVTINVLGPNPPFPVSATTLAITTLSTAPGAATRLVWFGPDRFNYQTCTKLMMQVQDAASTPTTSAANRTVVLATDNTGNFYSDANCSTTPINSITLTAGVTREASIYFAKTTIAPAGQVVSLFGNANTALYGAGGSGQVTIRWPRGLLVDYTGSTINGFYATVNNSTTNDTHHRLIYVNNLTTDQTIGGVTLYASQASGANHLGAAVVGIGSAGFNGDDLVGSSAKLYYPWGLSYNSDRSSIYIADNTNYRVRKFDPTIPSGLLRTTLGQGRIRNGFMSDSPVAATEALLNSPSKLALDDATRKMYISDSTNGRIRRVDLLTGTVDTIIGRGLGDASVDPEDPLFVYQRSGRGMVVATIGSNKFLIYTDNQAVAPAVNTTCLVRAMNLSTSTGNLFGVTIPAGKVATIAGDFAQGCGVFNGTGSGTSRKLNQPEDLAFDGTNLYVVVTADHCILKLASDGTMSSIMGNCGVQGTANANDGQSSVALSRSPMGITLDLDNLGNLLFSDQPGDSTGRIRYINTTSSTLTIGGTSAQGWTSGNVSRTTSIWQLIPSGTTSRINGMASFGNIVCWAAGLTSDGNTGPHAIYCADKTATSINRIAGPSESSSNTIRGGAPLGTEQEGIPAINSVLGAPYGLSFDASGNLYIVERLTHTVRMIRRWF